MSEATRKMIDKIMGGLQWVLEGLIFVLFLIVVCSGAMQIVGREFLQKSFIWSEELCRYAGIWLIMLATAILFGNDSHINLDYFLLKFPKKIQKVIMFINYVVMIGVMVWFTYYTLVIIQRSGSTPSPALSIPMGIVYLCLVFCGIFSILFMLYSAVKYYFYPEKEIHEEGGIG